MPFEERRQLANPDFFRSDNNFAKSSHQLRFDLSSSFLLGTFHKFGDPSASFHINF